MMERAFGQRDPGPWAGDEALIVNVDLELAFQDVKRFVLPAVSVGRWPRLRWYQDLNQGEDPTGALAAGLDRIVIADDPDRSTFPGPSMPLFIA
jgi:hypothetical protein